MTTTGKIIKYFAIAFAAFLIVGIITGATFIVYSIFGIDSNNEKKEIFSLNASIKETLEIDLRATNLVINESNEFSVETNNKYINVNNANEKLIIKEKKHNLFKNEEYDLILNIPKDYLFNKFEIDAGAGKIVINKLNTKTLDLDLGAGSVKIDNLEVSTSSSIDGGAGEIEITNALINNLDLDMGVGKCTIDSELLGNTDIDAGIGELNLNINGTLEDYSIKVSKGLGEINLNNQEMTNEKVYGTGENNISIDGGIGKIDISLNKF